MEPISGIPAYDRNNCTPYTVEWMLSFERQAGPHAVLDASYVGNSSRRQRVLVEANPGALPRLMQAAVKLMQAAVKLNYPRL